MNPLWSKRLKTESSIKSSALAVFALGTVLSMLRNTVSTPSFSG